MLIAAAILASTGSSTYISCYILGCAARSLSALVFMLWHRAPTEPAEPTWIRVSSPVTPGTV